MRKKKSIKISQVKRKNHIRNKLAKRGKLKTNKSSTYYGIKPKNTRPPEKQELNQDGQDDSDIGEEMLGMMESDDIAYLQHSVAARSYDIFKKLRLPGQEQRERARGHLDHKNENDLWEQLYEMKRDQPDEKRTKLLLPIKTKKGLVMRSTEVDELEEEKQKLEREMREKEKEEERKRKKEEKRKKKKGLKEEEEEEKSEKEDEESEKEDDNYLEILDKEYELAQPRSITTVDLLACREELLRKRKFQIGLLAAGLLENPEMKVRNFKFLLEILNKEHSEVKLTVRKLAALSLLEIFKDLLPSYQLKHQEADGVKLKKTTMQLQTFEKSLLKAYKDYLQSLERMTNVLRRKRGDTRPQDEKAMRLGLVGVRCMAELLVGHPYFNFAPNIAQSLVHFLNHGNPVVREISVNGLRTVLKEDKRGEITLHIVRRINQLVRDKEDDVRPEILTVLLALHLRDVNLDAEKEAEIKEKKLLKRKQQVLKMSKRERKRQKRLEELEREMLETKAEESKQTKQKYLTEVTKVVFTIFFRILKRAPSSKLLTVTLEGLSKFAHCINLEFFQDLINVLNYLLTEENLGHVEQLHCVETVFIILSGQGEALNIDPMRFYSHLYQSLVAVHAGRTNGDAVIVLRALEKAVIGRRRKLSVQRLMAFTKRLCTLAPHLLHGTALGYLAVVRDILIHVSACDALLDTEAHGDGIYQPELPEPEYCGASASILWELLLMKRHYHPDVRQMADNILKNGQSILPPEISKLTPSALAKTYDCSQMVFRPAVPPPRQTAPRAHRGRLTLVDDELAQYIQNVENSVNFTDMQNFKSSESSVSHEFVGLENSRT